MNTSSLISPSLAQLLNPPSANTTSVSMHLQNLQSKYAQLVSIPTQPVHHQTNKLEDHLRHHQPTLRTATNHVSSTAAAAAAAAVAAAHHHHHHQALHSIDYATLANTYNSHSLHSHLLSPHAHALLQSALPSLNNSALHAHQTAQNIQLHSNNTANNANANATATAAATTAASTATTATSVSHPSHILAAAKITDAAPLQLKPGSYGIRHLSMSNNNNTNSVSSSNNNNSSSSSSNSNNNTTKSGGSGSSINGHNTATTASSTSSSASSTIKFKKMACGSCRKAKSR